MGHRAFFLLAWVFSSVFFASAAQAAERLAVAPAQYREVAQTYSAEGVVEAARQSTVSAQIAGRVKEINFDVGDTVKKGQIILRIDEREAAQTLAGSQAQVMQAQAAMQNAKSNYERSRQLFAQKFISQAALDKAQADYKMALAQLRVIVDIPQYKMAEIGAHPHAMVELPLLNRQVQAASVTVQPAADARTHSSQARVYLPANEAGLYPGMYVRVHFVVGKANKLLIPAGAVVRRSEVTAVYVVDDSGAVKLRQVRLGEAAGEDEIEVLAGLNAGEQVALDPVKAGMSQQAK